MAIRIVRLGSPRGRGEGVRLGTVRRPPRGVARTDYARRDFYDAWLPELSPSPALVRFAYAKPLTDARWRQFARKYAAEMRAPAAQHLLATLAALSAESNFSVGCYCEDPARCHRTLLAQLLQQHGARIDA